MFPQYLRWAPAAKPSGHIFSFLFFFFSGGDNRINIASKIYNTVRKFPNPPPAFKQFSRTAGGLTVEHLKITQRNLWINAKIREINACPLQRTEQLADSLPFHLGAI